MAPGGYLFLITTLMLALSLPTAADRIQLDGHDLDAWVRAVLPAAAKETAAVAEERM